MAAPKPIKVAADARTAGQQSEALTLQDRHTDELVIGFVGPVASGVTTSAMRLKSIFEETYNYQTSYIRVSELIREFAGVVGEEVPPELTGKERITMLQAVGTKFRKTHGDSYLAQKVVERIGTAREQTGGYEEVGDQLVVKPRRHVHIIDSLKNPAEVKLLRDVYGDTFWLFGIFAPEELRQERMLHDGVDATAIQHLMSVDAEEGVDHGQRVRETIHQADFFVRNDGENDERLKHVLARYLSILFNTAVNTPTLDETGMYKAMSAAASSACLSRQVGAAIYTAAGELIGIGANDVPKKGGGLYSQEDGDKDNRCYLWDGKICHNDDRKGRLYADVFTKLTAGPELLAQGATVQKVMAALRKTDIKNLIEYSRAVHAEQEAILSVARGAKAGIVGATMYCTTFPCHSCAALIVASGIDRVFYVEPYAKSLALALHSDAISVRDQSDDAHVRFLQYEGVAPKNIIKLFNHGSPRKQDGKLLRRDPRHATPVFPSPLDGFSLREQIVVKRVASIESPKVGEGDAKGREAPAAQLPLDA